MTLLSSITARLLQRTRGPREAAAPAPAPYYVTPAPTLPVNVVGELEEFEEFLASLGFTTRLVRLPDARTRVDVAASTIQVGLLFFTSAGDLESAKLWERVPTVGIDVIAAHLAVHDGIRVDLDSSSEDLCRDVRDRLTALAGELDGVAA